MISSILFQLFFLFLFIFIYSLSAQTYTVSYGDSYFPLAIDTRNNTVYAGSGSIANSFLTFSIPSYSDSTLVNSPNSLNSLYSSHSCYYTASQPGAIFINSTSVLITCSNGPLYTLQNSIVSEQLNDESYGCMTPSAAYIHPSSGYIYVACDNSGSPEFAYINPTNPRSVIALKSVTTDCTSIYGTLSYIYFACGTGGLYSVNSVSQASVQITCSNAVAVVGDGNINGGLIYVMCGNTLSTISGASTLHTVNGFSLSGCNPTWMSYNNVTNFLYVVCSDNSIWSYNGINATEVVTAAVCASPSQIISAVGDNKENVFLTCVDTSQNSILYGAYLCPTGWYCPNSPVGRPNLCLSGNYCPNRGMITTGYACPAGSYCPAGSSNYTLCPTGSYSGPGATNCIPCASGFYSLNYQSCVSCEPGYYCPFPSNYDTRLPCTSTAEYCPGGTTQPFVVPSGAYTIDCLNTNQCSNYSFCSLGSYCLGGLQYNCSVGSYNNITSATLCTLCNAGSFSNTSGSTQCYSCSTGQYYPAVGGSTCISCSSGYFNAVPGSTGCSPCPPGHYSNGFSNSLCSSCAIGAYNPFIGASQCEICPIGTYTNSTGSSTCTICSPGSYSTSANSSSCTLCAIGYYQPSLNQASCLYCPAGSFTNSTGNNYCTPCAPGQFASSIANTQCFDCIPGSYSSHYNAFNCLDCSSGSYSPVFGSTQCLDCAAPLVVTNNGSTCLAETIVLTSGDAITPGHSAAIQTLAAFTIIVFVILLVLSGLYLQITTKPISIFSLLVSMCQNRTLDLIQILGILFMIISIFPAVLASESSNPSDSYCQEFIWLFCLGYTSHHASLLAHTRALINLLTDKGELNTMHQRAFYPAYRLTTVCILFELILLLSWQFTSPLTDQLFLISADDNQQTEYYICWPNASTLPVIQFLFAVLFSFYSIYYGFKLLIQLKNKFKSSNQNQNQSSSHELMSFKTQVAAFSPIIVLLFSEIVTVLLLFTVFIISIQSAEQVVQLYPLSIPISAVVYSILFAILYCFSHSSELQLIVNRKHQVASATKRPSRLSNMSPSNNDIIHSRNNDIIHSRNRPSEISPLSEMNKPKVNPNEEVSLQYNSSPNSPAAKGSISTSNVYLFPQAQSG